MRFLFSKLLRQSPFDKLLEHAEKIQSGGDMFRKAIRCYLASDCTLFEQLHEQVTTIEGEADRIKQNIRAHLPKGVMMPVEKFQFLWYLREEDKVMDSMQDALHWLSYRSTVIPDSLTADLLAMTDKAVEVIDRLPMMVRGSIRYFYSFSNAERDKVKAIIRELRTGEAESDRIERRLKKSIFLETVSDPSVTFHLIRLVEIIGEISNHAENAGDMMRAMIAR